VQIHNSLLTLLNLQSIYPQGEHQVESIAALTVWRICLTKELLIAKDMKGLQQIFSVLA
jgi:hypothetical protein